MIQRLEMVLRWKQGRTSERDDIVFYEIPPCRDDLMCAINAVHAHLERLVDRAYPARHDVEDGTPDKHADRYVEQINEFIELANGQEIK